MDGRQEGKLVTHICPTCGTALKFESGKKTTICPSCKNEVEKQFVVNLNFVSSSDDSAFKNIYSYDKSMFKFDFSDQNTSITNGIKKREFIEIPAHRLSPNDAVLLDTLIQEMLFKMDKPNKFRDKNDLIEMSNKILNIEDNNVYGMFFAKFLNGFPMESVLIRRDSLDKASFFVPYLTCTSKLLMRYYDDELDILINYILNSNLKTSEEKCDAISSILFEHTKEKKYFASIAEPIFLLVNSEMNIGLKQSLIKKLPDYILLNDLQSLVQYIQVCLKLNLNIDAIFSKQKIKQYLYGFNGTNVSKLVDNIWQLDSLQMSKRLTYIKNILDQFLFENPINLSAKECAELFNSLMEKPLKTRLLNKYYEQIVLLSLIEKEDVSSIEKAENKKIKKQIKQNKNQRPKENSHIKDLWSFWNEYWWTKPFKICCLISFILVFAVATYYTFDKFSLLWKDDVSEGMSQLALNLLCSFVIFVPLGAIINTVLAPIKFITLYFKSNSRLDQDLKIKRMVDKKRALMLKAEMKNIESKKKEEFENAQLIAYLIEAPLDDKLKKHLIDLIKSTYVYQSYDEVLNLIDLINRSLYIDKDNLIKHLIYNCINLNTYQEALTTLEFIKRLNITAPKKDEITKFLLYNKTKKSLTSITGYLYLFSYLSNEVDRFKYLFSVICTYYKDLFYELNNVDVAYGSGDVSDDLYLLICKSSLKFGLASVTRDHFAELEKNVKQRLLNANIKDFSVVNKMANKKIIKWLNKKPLNEKTINSDSFVISHKMK